MIKRLLDIVFSAVGLIVLSPFFILFGFLIKIFDFGPIFYFQERVGRGGRNFFIVKFRSMVVNADQQGGQLTASGDKRVTPIGRLLRACKADELPQLWNVFKGEMSLVGPRPEVRHYVDCYSDAQARVLDLTPGITDLASLAFFDEAELLAEAQDPERFYIEQIVPEKIRINLEYAARANVIWDLILIIATVFRSFGLKLDLFSWMKISQLTVVNSAKMR